MPNPMNTCTIRDILRLALPLGTRLLTRQTGLKHQIPDAVGLRATLPAFPSLRGGELVIFALDEVHALDERLTLPHIVERLLEVPVGAMAVAGDIDPVAIAVAEQADLPLLQLPGDAHVRQVERDVRYLLDNRELQIERRAAHLYGLLTQQVALGHGLEAVLRTLGEATGRSTAFYTSSNVLHLEWGAHASGARFAELRPHELAHCKRNGHPYLVRTVGQGSQPLGYIALGGGGLDAWDETAAEQAAAALLLELAKQQAVQAVETRFGGELLQRIVSGAPVDMMTLQQQAAKLGFDLRRPHRALLVVPTDESLTVDDLVEELGRELKRGQLAAPYAIRDNAVLCLFPGALQEDRAAKLLQTLAARLPIAAGISTPAPTAASWSAAQAEARQALALGRHLFGPRSVTAYADLRVYRLLFELRSSSELWSFYQTTLGALVAYDRRHNAALLDTLDGYFASSGNLSQAAERLQIHRNTLLYRLRRIGQISGADLERPEDMLNLQVALKAHRVLASPFADERQPAIPASHGTLAT